MEKKKFRTVREIFTVYAITLVATTFILIWAMEIWRADLGIPFLYAGDALFGSMTIKSITENGWYLHNQFVGAPFGLAMYDFPSADIFNYSLIKIVSLFSSNYAVVVNSFFLLTFPLTALTSVFVFRCFNISNSIAVVFALLYSFIPYHFLRGEGHLFLAAYYVIPLTTMIVLWLWDDKAIFFSFDEAAKKFKLDIRHHKSILSIIVLSIAGSTGTYYAFFACFFIAIAGLSAFFYRKNKNNFFSALILIAFIAGSVFLQIIPSVINNYKHGANIEVAQRSPVLAEVYGLKIINLLLAAYDHRVPPLINNKYKSFSYPSQNENTFATLGCIGSLGFLLLLSVFLFRFKNDEPSSSPNIYKRLAVLNLSGILLATIGGFGSLFALLVSPQIRAYNRISIFIAFFSLFAVALFLESFRQMHVKTNRQKYIFYLALIILLSVGILDQTTKQFIPNYNAIKEEFLVDGDFVTTIEKTVPLNSMIFQLPYIPFPENPSVYNMTDYALFRGYLHSHNLRWSYGAMKGRNGDVWYRIVAEKPLDEFLTTISIIGFNGIYIDKKGYADKGAKIEAELTDKLKSKPIVSKNNKLLFFNMADFNTALKEEYTAIELEELKQTMLYPLELSWQGGFYGFEGTPDENWRWSSAQGELRIKNPLPKSRIITLEMSFTTGWQEISNLYIKSPLVSENLKINDIPSFFSRTIVVPPGEHVITFISDAKKMNAPKDPRFLVFKVINFEAKGALKQKILLPLYTPGFRIALNTSDANQYLIAGWSGPEPQFRWTDGKIAQIGFRLKNLAPLQFRIRMAPFLVKGKHELQTVKVSINKVEIATLHLSESIQNEHQFYISKDILRKANIVEFKFENSKSPFELNLSDDRRKLAVAVEWFEFNPQSELS